MRYLVLRSVSSILKIVALTISLQSKIFCLLVGAVAKPARQFGHAMQI